MMRPDEIAKVQEYLRKTFDNNRITVVPPSRPKAPVEVTIGGEFLGVLHRDDDDGEISFSLHITILDIDLQT